MNSFEQARSALLAASKEKRNYERALSEWEYLGNLYDNGFARAVCRLCGQQDIRYEFEIVNQENKNSLLVGSECVTKFGHVKVYDYQGNQLKGKEAKAKVASDKRSLIADSKTRSVLNSLVLLAGKDQEFDINSFIQYYRERGAFTPNQLVLLIWRLNECRVPYNKAHLKMIISRDREKRQLLSLTDWKLAKIMPCLTSAQRQWLVKNSGN